MTFIMLASVLDSDSEYERLYEIMMTQQIRRAILFYQAEDGIRDHCVTGVQSCAFLFSSRRRHTRSLCDWSSDVCSSDLFAQTNATGRLALPAGTPTQSAPPVQIAAEAPASTSPTASRSEERRVGKECRSRWSPYH